MVITIVIIIIITIPVIIDYTLRIRENNNCLFSYLHTGNMGFLGDADMNYVTRTSCPMSGAGM